VSNRNNPRKSVRLHNFDVAVGLGYKYSNHISFSFELFCKDENGQHFTQWQEEKILADLNDKLCAFCCKTKQELMNDGTLEIYDDYPSGSKFSYPSHIQKKELQWARLRLTGRRRLIGVLIQDGKQREHVVFYVVFLDENHRFAPSKKKHT
jgi:hypothetical protein